VRKKRNFGTKFFKDFFSKIFLSEQFKFVSCQSKTEIEFLKNFNSAI